MSFVTNINTNKPVCSICSDTNLPSDKITKFACGHFACYQCMADWSRYSKNCSLCRNIRDVVNDNTRTLQNLNEYYPRLPPKIKPPTVFGDN